MLDLLIGFPVLKIDESADSKFIKLMIVVIMKTYGDCRFLHILIVDLNMLKTWSSLSSANGQRLLNFMFLMILPLKKFLSTKVVP